MGHFSYLVCYCVRLMDHPYAAAYFLYLGLDIDSQKIIMRCLVCQVKIDHSRSEESILSARPSRLQYIWLCWEWYHDECKCSVYVLILYHLVTNCEATPTLHPPPWSSNTPVVMWWWEVSRAPSSQWDISGISPPTDQSQCFIRLEYSLIILKAEEKLMEMWFDVRSAHVAKGRRTLAIT